ncbi:MAG: ABC transporter permease [Armatimonadota bacterium]|nr:ABC transporter permease [Armatimonadota bacterium]
MRFWHYELAVERRPAPPAWHAVLTAGLAIVLALLLSSVLFISGEGGLLSAYRVVFAYAFVNPHGLVATIHRAIYLLFCAFAFLVPLRAGLWNIGLPGQVYAGALAAFAVPFVARVQDAAALPLPPAILIMVMVMAAAAAGAALGGLAGVLRARLNVNEILLTMMLNSIVFWLVANLIKEGGPFMSATAEGEGFALAEALRAPLVFGVPVTVALALGAALVLDFAFARTTFGYRVRAFGESPAAARYAGIGPARLSVAVFLVGGAFAGLAGYHYFGAVPGLYKIPGNYGYYGDLAFYGIICALIARGSSLGVVPVAVLFAGLSLGARFAQGALRLPFGVDYAMLGLLMMTFVGSHVLYHFRMIWRPAAVPPLHDVAADRP